MARFLSFSVLFGLLSASVASPSLLERNFKPEDTITRDVVILGGGATGTFAAVRLREDFGKSVVVIEKSDRLGGHTDTYFDPVTGYPVDFGVQAWIDNPTLRNFTSRFNIPLVTAVQPPFGTDYIDFKTGKPIPGFAPPSQADVATALGTYFGILSQWPYLAGGYNLPDPVPSDLLLPFGDFVKQYGIQAAVPTIWTFAQSVGDLLATPTLYVAQTFGIIQLNALFNNGFVVPANHVNSEIYLKAAGLLGADVLYNTVATDVARHDTGYHQITVKTPTGKKLIKAKKILVTIPPTEENLKPFSLDHNEGQAFLNWQTVTYYTGIIRGGIPDNLNVINTQAGTTLNIPQTPFVQAFSFSGIPGLHTFHTVSLKKQKDSDVQAEILGSLTTMSAAGTYPASTPSIEALVNHSPMLLQVSADKIKKGFYANMNALQGVHGTYYTGSAWSGDYTSVLWAFTDALLPGIAAAAV